MTITSEELIVHKDNYIKTQYKVFTKVLDSLLDYTLFKTDNYIEDIENNLNILNKVFSENNMDGISYLCRECNDIILNLKHAKDENKSLIYDALLCLSKLKNTFNELIQPKINSNEIEPLNNNDWEQSTWVQEYTNMTYTGNILIVDDDLLLLAILESIFRKEGYRVFVSSKPAEVIEIIEEQKIDVVLLDLIMPEKNGFEVFSEIKSIKPEICVIFLTANTKFEDKVKAIKAGVDGYITKPFQEEEVIANVESLLKKANIQRTSIFHDSLTGAFTRKYFKQRFNEERLKNMKDNTPLSVAFLDIDYFKKINDTYGHVFGDYILQAFAQKLRKYIRDSDELYRFGGDEFLILFTNTTQQDSYSVLERIRTHIEGHVFSLDEINEKVSISFSAGISMLDNPNEDMEKLLDKADKALYLSKETGRGKTTIREKINETITAKKKILIADEINIIGNLIKSRLIALGYSVTFAKNQNELMEKLDELSPDLVLLDILLPQFNVADTLKKILNKDNNVNSKVILVSSKQKDAQLSKYFKLGVHDYIQKPFSLQEIEQRIRRQLQ
ncbi:response regulator [Serpentinicella alkaliphila]|uniref:Stage 0 sporulation protein A homolog n=1 Tax=Serpentinicella alkaliphila TaxID=1734049 RepID=A0A4R2UG14_9FIRM|nr:response regulator [Serpentinicella alkaliphila]QUH25617.1 response regulator [Serpentinicella alkaliphila]TCQ06673.1 diguanylate cyclase (GGDEF)-like protein [Serpentinicella alkaliphila]